MKTKMERLQLSDKELKEYLFNEFLSKYTVSKYTTKGADMYKNYESFALKYSHSEMSQKAFFKKVCEKFKFKTSFYYLNKKYKRVRYSFYAEAESKNIKEFTLESVIKERGGVI